MGTMMARTPRANSIGAIPRFAVPRRASHGSSPPHHRATANLDVGDRAARSPASDPSARASTQPSPSDVHTRCDVGPVRAAEQTAEDVSGPFLASFEATLPARSAP